MIFPGCSAAIGFEMLMRRPPKVYSPWQKLLCRTSRHDIIFWRPNSMRLIKIQWVSQPVRKYINTNYYRWNWEDLSHSRSLWKKLLVFNSPRNIAGSVLERIEGFHAGFSLSPRKSLPMIWCSKLILGNASLNFRGVTRSLWLTG